MTTDNQARPNTPWSGENEKINYEQMRSRFPHLTEKTNNEINNLLKENNNRENYNMEFDINQNKISNDDENFDLEKFDIKFPGVGNLIINYIKSDDFTGQGNLVLAITYPSPQSGSGRKSVAGPKVIADNLKFWSPEHINIKRENKNKIIATLKITETDETNDFGRTSYHFQGQLIEIPAIGGIDDKMNGIYVKDIPQEDLSAFINAHPPTTKKSP